MKENVDMINSIINLPISDSRRSADSEPDTENGNQRKKLKRDETPKSNQKLALQLDWSCRMSIIDVLITNRFMILNKDSVCDSVTNGLIQENRKYSHILINLPCKFVTDDNDACSSIYEMATDDDTSLIGQFLLVFLLIHYN